MIDEIHVSNVALIRDASFSPSRGRSPAKRGRERRRSFRHANFLLVSVPTKPQFAKILTAYRSKAVSSSTMLLTSPRG